MQGFITTPIAKAVLNADNVDYVTSKSALGSSHRVGEHACSTPTPTRRWSTFSPRCSRCAASCRPTPTTRSSSKGTGQNFALMYLAVRSTTMNPQQVTEYPDAGDPAALRHRRRRRRRADPRRPRIRHARLARPDRSSPRATSPPPTCSTAIRASNFLSAPGKTENEFVAYAIQTATTLQTPESFGDAAGAGERRRDRAALRDVAKIELRRRERRRRGSASTARRARSSASSPSPGANALDTSAAVRAELPQIQSELPPGMTIELVYDASDNIRASIDEVFKTIAEAVVIVVLVILIFLGSFRSVLVPIFTIPLSLVGVCFILYVDRLFHQPADAARHGARHRPRRRRRHRGGGEHPPASRGRRAAARCGDRRHARDLHAGRRHDHHARRRLCADRLHAGPDRRALPRVRGDACRRRHHLRLHRASRSRRCSPRAC